jgi:hypothetical protein
VSDIQEELARLVHALRQPLSAARILTDELAHSRLGADAAAQLDLLSAAVREAIEVGHSLAALAARSASSVDDAAQSRTEH